MSVPLSPNLARRLAHERSLDARRRRSAARPRLEARVVRPRRSSDVGS